MTSSSTEKSQKYKELKNDLSANKIATSSLDASDRSNDYIKNDNNSINSNNL